MRPSQTSCNGSMASTSLHPSFPSSSSTSFLRKNTNHALQVSKTKAQHGSLIIWTRCVRIASYLYSTELLQVLDTLDPFSPAHRECLHELQVVCGTRRNLPRSYIPRCMDDTPGHDNCGPGEIFRWSFGFDVEFRRMFPLHKVFSSEGTEVGVFFWRRHLSLRY